MCRLFTVNPSHEIFNFLAKDIVKDLNSVELFKDRLKRIEKYDQRVVEDFKKSKEIIDSILSQEVDSENVNKDAIKELYRVYAIKDEYEVARMHLETTEKTLNKQFTEWKNINFYLSPPLLSYFKDKRTGRPRKFQVPGYIAIPAFKLLRSLKFLRGTWLDPLNISADRVRDKNHKSIFINKLHEINKMRIGEKSRKLEQLVNASKNVKGYGPVREQAHNLFLKFINETFNSKEKVHKAKLNIRTEQSNSNPNQTLESNKDKNV